MAVIAALSVLFIADASTQIDGKSLWYICVLGLSIIVYRFCAVARAPRFGVMSCVLLAGGAAQLWITEPVWFPSVSAPSTLVDFLFFGIVMAQAIIVIVFLRRNPGIPAIIDGLRGLGGTRCLILLAALSALTVSPMGFLGDERYLGYAARLVAGTGFIGINFLTLVALVVESPPRVRLGVPSPLVLAGATFGLAAGLSIFAFQNVPQVQDEVVYIFQAKTFAEGLLAAPAPPEALRDALDYYLLDIRDGRWFSTMPPGWPALLSAGVLLGELWLVNAALAAVSILLAHGVIRRLFSIEIANLTALLMTVSPLVLAMSASLMSHTAAQFFLLLGWWSLVAGREQERAVAIWSLCAGLSLGLVFLTRPIDGLALGILTGLILVLKVAEKDGITRVVAYSAGCIASGSLFLVYCWILTGSPLVDPLSQYYSHAWPDGSNAYGFGADIGPPELWGRLDLLRGHSPFEGLFNTAQNLTALQLDLLGWGVGSLAPLFFYLLWGRFRGAEMAAISVVIVMIAVTFFYWFAGGFYISGRYWFSAIVPLLALSSAGCVAMADRLAEIGVPRERLNAALAILCLFSVLVFLPWRGLEKYREFLNFTADVSDAYESGAFGTSVVFVDLDGDPGAALFLNDPLLRETTPIFLIDPGDGNRSAIIAATPGRSVQTYPQSILSP